MSFSAPTQQKSSFVQSLPNGHAITQRFAPMVDALKQSWGQAQAGINGLPLGMQAQQSPVFNSMNFGRPTVQAQLPPSPKMGGAGS